MNKSESNSDKNLFLYPIKSYNGLFSPENLVFNANLQEFAQKVNYISGLHTNGKLSSEKAYQQIERLWLQLQQSKNAMNIDNQS